MARARTRRLTGGPRPDRPTAARGAERVEAVLGAARSSGLLGEKSARIGGRVSPELLAEARKRTGLESDSDLIEFALAGLAIDDDFPTSFRRLDSTVDPGLDLEF